jgi:hypothetical protein
MAKYQYSQASAHGMSTCDLPIDRDAVNRDRVSQCRIEMVFTIHDHVIGILQRDGIEHLWH